jgi:hypothetical protein
MTATRRPRPNWWFIGLGFVCLFAGLGSNLDGQSPAIYFTLYSLAIAFLIAALVDLRLDALDRKLDEVLERLRRANQNP